MNVFTVAKRSRLNDCWWNKRPRFVKARLFFEHGRLYRHKLMLGGDTETWKKLVILQYDRLWIDRCSVGSQRNTLGNSRTFTDVLFLNVESSLGVAHRSHLILPSCPFLWWTENQNIAYAESIYPSIHRPLNHHFPDSLLSFGVRRGWRRYFASLLPSFFLTAWLWIYYLKFLFFMSITYLSPLWN